MKADKLARAETIYFREVVTLQLEENRFHPVTQSIAEDDGWRAEFIGEAEHAEVVLLAHKPESAPYISLSCLLNCEAPQNIETMWTIADVCAAYEVAWCFADRREGPCQLSQRLALTALNHDGLTFFLANLLFCRQELSRELSA